MSARTGTAEPAVVLFVYNRPLHTAQVCDALLRDGVRSLYVFSDGPRDVRDAGTVEATRRVIRERAWAELHLVERATNIGLARSIILGVSDVLAEHESVIVLEDDCVPLDGFLRYMRRALDHYASVDDVACISGYGPPGVRRPRSYRADGYFTTRISSWGWGTWRDAWRQLDSDWTSIRRRIEAERPDLAAGGADLRDWLTPEFEARIGHQVWTPLWLFPLLLDGRRTLWPFASYVRNIGLDASGVNARDVALPDAETPVPPEQFRFPADHTTNRAITRQFAAAIAQRPTRRLSLARLRDVVSRSAGATRAYYAVRRALHLPDANTQQTYARLVRHAGRTPRYRPGRFTFPFGDVEYVDVQSLLSQYREIFVERGYDVQAGTESPRVIDCGGNIGLSVIRLKQQYPAARVTVFEADPDIADVLDRNITRLGLGDVEIVRAAAWTHAGTVGFAADGSDMGRVAATPSATAVRAVRLADVLTESVDLLKLDIEGAEFAVLDDLHRSGALAHVQRLICEVHVRPDTEGSVAALLSLLERERFRTSLSHARPAPDLAGADTASPFPALSSSKYLLHLHAWREHAW